MIYNSDRVTSQWLAGFLDGDGRVNVGFSRGSRFNWRPNNLRVQVIFYQKGRDLLDLILIKFPGGTIHERNDAPGNFTLRYMSKSAMMNVLMSIRDFVVLKQNQVESAILCLTDPQRVMNTATQIAKNEQNIEF